MNNVLLKCLLTNWVWFNCLKSMLSLNGLAFDLLSLDELSLHQCLLKNRHLMNCLLTKSQKLNYHSIFCFKISVLLKRAIWPFVIRPIVSGQNVIRLFVICRTVTKNVFARIYFWWNGIYTKSMSFEKVSFNKLSFDLYFIWKIVINQTVVKWLVLQQMAFINFLIKSY